MKSWADGQVEEFGTVGAEVLRKVAVGQRDPERTAIALAAGLASSGTGGATPRPLLALIAAAADNDTSSALGTFWLATCFALQFDSFVRSRPPPPEDDEWAGTGAYAIVLWGGLHSWIAAGRPMEPVAAAADSLMQWAPSMDRRVLVAENATAAFGMLPEIERRSIRETAVAWGRTALVEGFDRIAPPRDY